MSRTFYRSPRLVMVLPPLCLLGISLAVAALIDTTPNDFLQPGTQPNALNVNVFPSTSCTFCHGNYDEAQEPYQRWAASMMAQSVRDPVFLAALAIANQDLAGAGEFCFRCHAPGAFLAGRATPADGSAFEPEDFDGINCHFCHRMVDPIFDPNANPAEDVAILAAIDPLPADPHSGQYIVDPDDRRRGPYDLGSNFPYHAWALSPYHRESLACASCHDVSNPAFTRQPDGTYVLGPLDAPHPTFAKVDAFPLDRTFSEWSQSAFALGPIDMGGRFGGNQPLVSSCQDCHMPKTTGQGASPIFDPPVRTDLAQHDFNGANTWVLQAVKNLYDDGETGLSQASVDAALARTQALLAAASDLELSVERGQLRTRVINQTGHKLPTGYPEGRRMWVNLRFFDASDALISEVGGYDEATATLDTAGTKVYEAKFGIDAAVAQLTGLPVGPSFHAVLVSEVLLDNRIPPRGFTNAGFESVQAEPVGATYPDGQFWDDTLFAIPRSAARVEARVFYQTTSRAYIEFLRDTNTTNNAGQVAYDQWVATGKSAPAEMDFAELILSLPGDLNGDGVVNQRDLNLLLAQFGCLVGCSSDLDGDDDVDQLDLNLLLANWGG